MRIFSILILLTVIYSGFGYAAQEVLKYKISADCIESIDVLETEYSGYWSINVELTNSAGVALEALTKNNLGRKFMIVDSQANEVGLSPATLQASLSRQFRMAGFKSKESANKAKKQIMSNDSACGLHLTNA